MDNDLHFQLHDGFVTAARLVARLHALGIAVDELRMTPGRMSIRVAGSADARRVRAVLARCVDASLEVPEPVHTTYVVSSEPLDESAGRRRPRISA